MLSSHDALHFRRTSAFVIGVHLSMAGHSKAFTPFSPNGEPL